MVTKIAAGASSDSSPPKHSTHIQLREHFPILGETTYLISNSLGAMPREVAARQQDYCTTWQTRGVRAWHEGWWEMPLTVGDLVAPLIGAAPGSVAMQPNVTLATAIFLSAIDYPEAKSGLVTTAHDFPSVRYLLEGERDKGAEIRVVGDLARIEVGMDELIGRIDDSTRLVVVSHVLFRTATVLDVAELARHCRHHDAILLVDVYQSAGIMEVDLQAWGVHAAVGGCLKWLCGGPGNAFLWIDEELSRQLRPRLTGWQSHQEPFAFEENHRPVEHGAARWLTGTPAIAALEACRPGLEILGSLDMSEVRARSLHLTGQLIEQALAAGFEVHSPREPERRGGTITVAHPRSQELSVGLLERDILCDYRPQAGIRLSPHFYTLEDEISFAIDTLSELRDGLGP